MNNAEIKTLHIDKDNYTDQQWEWLINNWDEIHQKSRYLLDQQVEKYEGEFISDITTSVLVELSVGMFNSKEDYLEFRDIDEEILQNQIVKWYYSFRCANNCRGSVYKTDE